MAKTYAMIHADVVRLSLSPNLMGSSELQVSAPSNLDRILESGTTDVQVDPRLKAVHKKVCSIALAS